MPTSSPAYAVFRIDGRRVADLPAVVAHNDRRVAVPNADPAVPNKRSVPWVESTPTSAIEAITSRLRRLDLLPPHPSRHIAYEAVFTVSAHAAPMPPAEILEERGLAFCRDEFGEDSIIASWLHLDEKTPHLHVLGIPLVTGRKPGRPKRGQPPKAPIKTISWNQFSGANQVNFREAARAKAKARNEGTAKPAEFRNRRLEQLQTAWALRWADYGLRRGIPSDRAHRSPGWIRARTDQIEKMAAEARAHLTNPGNWLTLAGRDWLEFMKAPTGEALALLVAKFIPQAIDDLLAPLIELAKRGVQLPLEQEARASIADAKAKADHEAEQARGAHARAMAENASLVEKVTSLDAANKTLEQELQHLRWLAEDRPADLLAAELASLSDTEFERMIERRRELAQETIRLSGAMPPRPSLPTPRPAPAPKLAPE